MSKKLGGIGKEANVGWRLPQNKTIEEFTSKVNNRPGLIVWHMDLGEEMK